MNRTMLLTISRHRPAGNDGVVYLLYRWTALAYLHTWREIWSQLNVFQKAAEKMSIFASKHSCGADYQFLTDHNRSCLDRSCTLHSWFGHLSLGHQAF